jgi:hypothetical protein
MQADFGTSGQPCAAFQRSQSQRVSRASTRG